MTSTEATRVLREHNEWRRRGQSYPSPYRYTVIDEAIDVAVEQLAHIALAEHMRGRPQPACQGRSRRLARHKARAQAGRRWDTRGTPGATYETPIRTIGVIHWSGMWASSTLLVRRPSRQKVRAK